jgi:N-acyl-D-aspartate/D-glutamate deacylase
VLDLLIKGGMVVDGTGSARCRADVAIQRGRIREVGNIEEKAAQTIDAEGMVVAPGFLDVHTHYDVQGFWDPTLSPSPLHGVTSVIGGNCGFSVAPLTQDATSYLIRMLSRVEGMPLTSLEHGASWDWGTTGEYLARLEGRLSVNAGFLVGHSTLRRVVMGPAATERECTDDELGAMCDLLREGLAAGGLGFSSSVGESHSDGDGRPVPSRHAAPTELLSLAAVCRDFPGTSLEFLPQLGVGRFLPERLDLMTAMSITAQRPLNWNLLQVQAGTEGQAEDRLEAGDHARERGGRIVALLMPLPVVSRISFSHRIFDMIDGWASVLRLPLAEKIRVLSEPSERLRLGELARNTRNAATPYTEWASYQIVEAFAPLNKRYQGQSVAAIAAQEGKDPFDALLDIVCLDDLRTTFMKPGRPDTQDDWMARAAYIRDPRVMIGASDAGAHLDTLATFNYPTCLLAEAVRIHQALTLEEAVHYLTQAPAQLYGLRDRGTLAPGMAGDVVVFDEATIGSSPVETRADLPGGASRLYAEATGIPYVIVNGQPILDHGTFTHAQPGSILHSGRDTLTPSLSLTQAG